MENTQTIFIGLVILVIMWVVFDGQKTKVYRFHRPGCEYCKRSQEEWEDFKYKCMFRMISPVDINMDEADDKEKDMFAAMGGSGVPHVATVDRDGNNWVHQGERTADDYMRWVNNLSVGGFSTKDLPVLEKVRHRSNESYGTMEY
jgi:hypothetical protein